MEAYEKYISTMKRLKATPPYMSETDFKIAHGIKDETNSKAFTLTPKKDSSQSRCEEAKQATERLARIVSNGSRDIERMMIEAIE